MVKHTAGFRGGKPRGPQADLKCPAAAEGGFPVVPMKPEPRRRDPHLKGSLSLGQLARRWEISRKQIRHLLGRQELDFVQIRGKIRVPIAEIERYEQSGHRTL